MRAPGASGRAAGGRWRWTHVRAAPTASRRRPPTGARWTWPATAALPSASPASARRMSPRAANRCDGSLLTSHILNSNFAIYIETSEEVPFWRFSSWKKASPPEGWCNCMWLSCLGVYSRVCRSSVVSFHTSFQVLLPSASPAPARRASQRAATGCPELSVPRKGCLMCAEAASRNKSWLFE